jgi:hypothetical protein
MVLHITTKKEGRWMSFRKDGNKIYVIAQFYPRMAVYNDVEGSKYAVLGKWRICCHLVTLM